MRLSPLRAALLHGERLVRQALTVSTLHGIDKASAVLLVARIEAINLLLNIRLEMLRTRRNVRTLNRALEHRPETFDAIRVNVSANVFVRVIDDVVGVRVLNRRIRRSRVGIDDRSGFHILAQTVSQRLPTSALDDERANAALALHDPHDRRLVFVRAEPLERAVRLAQGRRLTADVGFVRFNRTAELLKRFLGHRRTNPVQYKPGRPLRDVQPASDFVGRNAVAVAGNEPNRREPLGERDRRILKDRPDLGRELPLAIVAVPAHLLFEEGHAGRSAAHPGASHAVRKANLDEEVVRDLRIGKLPNRFDHRVGDRLLVHEPILPNRLALVK